jgi:FlaA1/EpsC-like NDP-sugar epimerase
MPHPRFTAKKRSTTYATIDPARPELSVKGKTLYVTGASPGTLGAGIAAAFVSAGIAKVGVFGRTESKLQQTKADLLKINPEVTVFTHIFDAGNAESVGVASHWARSEIGGNAVIDPTVVGLSY